MIINNDDNKTLIEIFTKNAIVMLVIGAIVIACSFSLLSYYEFNQNSKNYKDEYLKNQKELIQREVTNVEKIIHYERSKLDVIIRTNIKQRVNESHAIATNLYNKFKDTKSKHEIINIIKEALRQLRFFDGRGYVFILDLEGINILNSNDPSLEGKNIVNLQDSDGTKIIRNAIKIINEKGEGFNNYKWEKPNEKGTFDKFSYLQHFKPYDWMIGTGDYVVEVERQIKKEVLERIGQITFDKQGYIFVVNYDGTVMMNRGQPSIIGKNIIHITDPNGVPVAAEVIKHAKDPNWDGFFKYSWKKYLSETVSRKLAYHKTVPEWEWYYGTGVYLDDVDSELVIKQNELNWKLLIQLILIFFITLLSTISLYFFAKRHAGRLNEELNQILDFFNSLTLNSEKLDVDPIKYAEFKQLGITANTLLEKLQSSEKERQNYERQIQQTQTMNAVTQLIGGIAHDFNNLLGGILGFGELIKLRVKGQPKLEKYADQVITSGHRGEKLIKKLLSLVIKHNTKKEVVNLCTLLKNEEVFVKNSLTAMIDFEIDCHSDSSSFVMIDKSDFQDVILNLCINAMHAMSSGQRDSKISITINNIQLSGNEAPNLNAGEHVKLAITDNGEGMDADTIKHIFEPFYTSSVEGSGLGLSQVYSFCKRSGGAVTVTSKPGEGTTFYIFLPRVDAVNETLVAEVEKTHVSGDKCKTILVTDDEKTMRDLCVESLTLAGYKTLEAKNGVEALSVLADNKVDLLLSDIIMPNMDGHVLVEKVTELYPNLPIQLMSGYIGNDNLPKITSEVYQNLINKPFSPSVIVKRIDELLS